MKQYIRKQIEQLLLARTEDNFKLAKQLIEEQNSTLEDIHNYAGWDYLGLTPEFVTGIRGKMSKGLPLGLLWSYGLSYIAIGKLKKCFQYALDTIPYYHLNFKGSPHSIQWSFNSLKFDRKYDWSRLRRTNADLDRYDFKNVAVSEHGEFLLQDDKVSNMKFTTVSDFLLKCKLRNIQFGSEKNAYGILQFESVNLDLLEFVDWDIQFWNNTELDVRNHNMHITHCKMHKPLNLHFVKNINSIMFLHTDNIDLSLVAQQHPNLKKLTFSGCMNINLESIKLFKHLEYLSIPWQSIEAWNEFYSNYKLTNPKTICM
jgi:hypothetical protein